MSKDISQKIVLPSTPEKLYGMYLSAKGHTALTGMPAKISNKTGAPFRAFGGMLTGKILFLAPGRTIVQTWRSKKFHKGDRDSILILNFSKVRKGTRIDLAHIHVPDHDYADIKKGWPRYYWKPWAAYLKRKQK
jgi:activator of HSP90 ATPase